MSTKNAIIVTVAGPAKSGRSAIAQTLQDVLGTYGIEIVSDDDQQWRDVKQLTQILESVASKIAVQIAVRLPQPVAADDDGWEWAIVEVFGHRRHVGRAREEERFGSKYCRIDVPTVGPAEGEITWHSHFYSGGSIFSYTPTDEKTVMRHAERKVTPALPYRDHEPESSFDEDADDDQREPAEHDAEFTG